MSPVAPPPSVPKPPPHLSRASKALWRSLVEDFELDSEPHALRTLTLACEALDRGDEARQALAKHGTIYVDRFGAPKARPEVAMERDCRLAAVRCLRELALDGQAEARVPRVGGDRS